MYRLLPILLVANIAWITGCSTLPSATKNRIIGESAVLVGSEPAHLAFLPHTDFEVNVRSTYMHNLPSTFHYERGKDFELDPIRGTISRLPGSRIPDFRTNMLYGIEPFDHSRFPGFGNNAFFVYMDYAPKQPIKWPVQELQTEHLKRTQSKLANGAPLKIVAFGIA